MEEIKEIDLPDSSKEESPQPALLWSILTSRKLKSPFCPIAHIRIVILPKGTVEINRCDQIFKGHSDFYKMKKLGKIA